VVSTSGEVVVVVVIVLGVGEILGVLDEANVLWHVQLFAKVLDVKTKINDHFLSVVRVTVTNQERTGNAAHNTVPTLELSLNVVVAEECLLLHQACIFFMHELDQLLTKEGIVNLLLFVLNIEAHRHGSTTEVNLLDSSVQAKFVEVKTNSFLSYFELLLRVV